MNGLKSLALSVTATAFGAASSAADEPGNNGFFMDFSVVDFNPTRPDAYGVFGNSVDFSGVLRFGYGGSNFSTDLEFGVRSPDEERYGDGGGGSIEVYMAMINAAMDFDPYDGIAPFFAFGIGSAIGDGDSDSSGFTEITPIGHVDIGAQFTLSPTASMSFSYSLLVMPPNDRVPTPAHSLTVGFDYRF